MNEYSQWFFAEGWIIVSIFGFIFGWVVGLKAYWVVLPAVLLAIWGK